MITNPGVVVTGGTSGIGLETCIHFASRGYRVSLCGRNLERVDEVVHSLRTNHSASIFGAQADVRDMDQVLKFAEDSLQFHGPIGCLISNAGVLGPIGPIIDVMPEDFDKTFQSNSGALVSLIRAFWGQLESCRDGRVVCLSGGGLGGKSPLLRAPAYVPSKAALALLVEVLHPELAVIGGTINAIAPGSIPTHFLKSAIDAGRSIAGDSLYEEAEIRDGKVPAGALDQYFDLLNYVLSSKASALTGRLLSARWDTPAKLEGIIQTNGLTADLFKLRRIDDDLFRES